MTDLATNIQMGEMFTFVGKNLGAWMSRPLLGRHDGCAPKTPDPKSEQLHFFQHTNWQPLQTYGRVEVGVIRGCELTGRSYGGGVLELMPGEANQLVMPPPIAALDGIFGEANRFMRTRQFHAVVEQVSALVAPVEMDYAQHQDALGILYTLVKRRKRTDKSL